MSFAFWTFISNFYYLIFFIIKLFCFYLRNSINLYVIDFLEEYDTNIVRNIIFRSTIDQNRKNESLFY